MKRYNFLWRSLLMWVVLLTACSEEYQQAPFSAPQATTDLGAMIVNNSNDYVSFLRKDSVYTLVPGLRALEMDMLNDRGLVTKLFLFEIDLKNSDLSILATTPNDGNSFGTQKMTLQAKAVDRQGSKVWAAVNGDFFLKDGTPQGAVVKRGVVLKSTFSDAICTVFAVMKDGTPKIFEQSEFTANKLDIQEAISGRVRLMTAGEILPQTSTVLEPRTGVGVTADKKVYFLCVDGRNFHFSNGMTYTDMARVFKSLGVRDAINLDGGGSTTFIIRSTPTFDDPRFDIRNWPYDGGGVERAVGNGLVVVSATH